MSVRLLNRNTYRWWLRPPVQRMTLRTGGRVTVYGRGTRYAPGIRSAWRLGPLVVTRYQECGCG